MDLRQLELAADIVFRMCREHPDICPHNYIWEGSTIDHNTGYKEVRYKCSICGDIYTKIASPGEPL